MFLAQTEPRPCWLSHGWPRAGGGGLRWGPSPPLKRGPSVSVRRGRGLPPRAQPQPQPTLSLANTQGQQMQEPRGLGSRSLCSPLPGPSPRPTQSEAWTGVGAGRAGAGGRGLSLESMGWPHEVQLLFPGGAQAGAGGPASRLTHHTSSPSGGCAGRGSWRRPCPGSA